jgi:hypothetical protein
LAVFGSAVAELTVAVSLTAVPAAVPEATCNANVNVADPTAKLAFVQLMVPAAPVAGVVQVQPVGGVIDWNVVSAGVVSVRLALIAVLGPEFVTTWV